MEQHGSTDPRPLTHPASARWRPTLERPTLKQPALDLSSLQRLDPKRLALERPIPGLLTYAQLVEEAGGRAGARRLLAEGLWWRVVRGAYAPIEVPDDTVARAGALRLVLPPDVAASHRTALWLLGLDVLGATLDVTVPRGRHLKNRPGLTTWCADLGETELVRVEGALAVSAARAFADVARTEHLVEAVAVGDRVLRSGAATIEQLEVALHRAAGLRGIIGARAVLPHLEPRSESLMESRFRMRLILGGVPRPEAQWDVYSDQGHLGRVDLHLRGVALEYDGRASRLDKVAFIAERRRQTGLAETGLEVRRFTSADYYGRPAVAVCAEVMRAVAQAAGRDRGGLRYGPDTMRPPGLRPLPTEADVRAADGPRTGGG